MCPFVKVDPDELDNHELLIYTVPSIRSDPDDHENGPILQNVPSFKADPDGPDHELTLHNIPSGHEPVLSNVPSDEADLDELEDHEQILQTDLLASIGLQEEQFPVSDASHPSPQDNLGSASVATPSTRALSVTRAAATPPVSSSFASREEFTQSQFADPPRLPWNWSNKGKSQEPYTPTAVRKWWYRSSHELETLEKDKRRRMEPIGRIMETELGQQKVGDGRCTACIANDQECWIYSWVGAAQISRPGDACTRCRAVAHSGGCSLSKRRKRSKSSSPSPRPLRRLLPMPSQAGSEVLESQGTRV